MLLGSFEDAIHAGDAFVIREHGNPLRTDGLDVIALGQRFLQHVVAVCIVATQAPHECAQLRRRLLQHGGEGGVVDGCYGAGWHGYLSY